LEWQFKIMGWALGALIASYALYRTYLIATSVAEEISAFRMFLSMVAARALALAIALYTAVLGESTIGQLTSAAALAVWEFAAGLAAAATTALTFVTEGLTAAWITLEAFMGPIGWILLLITTLTVLYFRWKAFHDLVNNTAEWVKNHWWLVGLALASPFLTAMLLIVRYFNVILNTAQRVYDWFAKHNIWGEVGNFLLPSGIFSAAGGQGHGGGGGSLGSQIFGYGRTALGILTGIPGLADGGTIVRPGLTLVGEYGPELVGLPQGARVQPLTAGVGGFGKIQLTTHVTVPVLLPNGKVLAESMAEIVTDAEARQ